MQDGGRMGNTLAQRVAIAETWSVWRMRGDWWENGQTGSEEKAPEGRQYPGMQ